MKIIHIPELPRQDSNQKLLLWGIALLSASLFVAGMLLGSIYF
ncbi:MAG: hypothetical protein AB7P69_03775 [Candidatus Binatia bacterium]